MADGSLGPERLTQNVAESVGEYRAVELLDWREMNALPRSKMCSVKPFSWKEAMPKGFLAKVT